MPLPQSFLYPVSLTSVLCEAAVWSVGEQALSVSGNPCRRCCLLSLLCGISVWGRGESHRVLCREFLVICSGGYLVELYLQPKTSTGIRFTLDG